MPKLLSRAIVLCLFAVWTNFPSDARSEPFTFAVVGDYGAAAAPGYWPGEGYVATMIDQWDPDIVITTGDNNYQWGSAETIDENIGQFYSQYIGNYQGDYGEGAGNEPGDNRFFPVIGDHDWATKVPVDDLFLPKPFLDYFTLPGEGFENSSENELFYDFRIGDTHFFAYDTSAPQPARRDINSPQAAWLKTELEESDAAWKVVYLHFPPFASDQRSTPIIQLPYQEWGADVVFAGHSHIYERLLVNNRRNDNFLYITSGVGGKSLAPDSRFINPVVGSYVKFNKSHGAVLVTIDDSIATFDFYSTDDGANGANGGRLIDRFVIDQDAPPLTSMPGPAAEMLTLVSSGEVWRYLDDGSDQGTAWREVGFVDDPTTTGWQDANAEFGYGDGDEVTEILFGDEPSRKHITTYFRKNFMVEDTSEFTGLVLELLKDDGAAVFINGQEALRADLPVDAQFDSLATVGTVELGETTFYPYPLSADLLTEGKNLLAVEIHQSQAWDNDLSFDMRLLAAIAPTLPTWQNPTDPFDVDDNSIVNALDLVLLIRDINGDGPRDLDQGNEPSLFLDVNGDELFNALDVLFVVRYLNERVVDPSSAAQANLALNEQQVGSVISVPEPASVGLLLCGIAVVLTTRFWARRRPTLK